MYMYMYKLHVNACHDISSNYALRLWPCLKATQLMAYAVPEKLLHVLLKLIVYICSVDLLIHTLYVHSAHACVCVCVCVCMCVLAWY